MRKVFFSSISALVHFNKAISEGTASDIVVTKKKGTMSKIMKIVTNIQVKGMTLAAVTVVTVVT